VEKQNRREQRVISQQLDGLAKVILNLAVEIDGEIKFKSDMEDVLLFELRNKGIKVNDVVVCENKWGKYEVNIFHNGCAEQTNVLIILKKWHLLYWEGEWYGVKMNVYIITEGYVQFKTG